MPGFLFIRNLKHADIAAKVLGALVMTASIVWLKASWSLPPRLGLLIPATVFVIGYKIFRRHSRILASAVAIAMGFLLVNVYLHRPSDSAALTTVWVGFGIAVNGSAATVAYRRLAGGDLYGLSHDEILQKTKTILSVTISACCCLLVALGVYSFVAKFPGNKKDLLALAIMPALVVAFCEPFLDYLSHVTSVKRVTMNRKRWIARIGVLLLGIIATVLHKGLELGLTQAEGFAFVLLLLLLFLPGQITGAWINGASRGRSWWTGLTRGCILGVLSVALLWIITANFRNGRPSPDFWGYLKAVSGAQVSISPASGQLSEGGKLRQPTYGWEVLAVANAAIWGLYGLLGGLAILLRKGSRVMLLSLLLAAVLIEVKCFSHGIREDDLIRFGIAQRCLVTGWVLGIVLYRPAGNLLFRDRWV
jgi:hypothetical protein